MNPDSAVAIDRKREARSFRSEVDGFVPLSNIDQRCCEGMLSFIAMTWRKAKMILWLQSRTPSLLQDCTSLPAGSVSGLNNLPQLGSHPYIDGHMISIVRL